MVDSRIYRITGAWENDGVRVRVREGRCGVARVSAAYILSTYSSGVDWLAFGSYSPFLGWTLFSQISVIVSF